jgi:outer membrane lipoprotein
LLAFAEYPQSFCICGEVGLPPYLTQEYRCMKVLPLLALSALLLGGCATYPESVRVSEETSLVSYEAAIKGGISQGTARWSGVIAKVDNNAKDTRLEIVYFPAKSNGRPQVTDNTAGRFVAYVPSFLDPLVYQQGKQITVLGPLAQPEAGMVDKYQYVFPVINQATVYLWPKQQEQTRVEIETWPMWRNPYYPYWGPVRVRTTHPSGATQTQGQPNVQSSSEVQQ